jgi:4-hydroxyphenylpyruvate dioxygenase-like putative hemolysin
VHFTSQRHNYECVELAARCRHYPNVTCTTMSDDPAVILHNLKRKCTRQTANATRFSTLLDEFDDSTSLDDFEHYRRRLQKTLDRLLSLDDATHNLLSDSMRKIYRFVKNILTGQNGQFRRLVNERTTVYSPHTFHSLCRSKLW